MVEPLMDTWWLWIAGAIVVAFMEVAFRGFYFLALAVGMLLTGLLIWSGVGPAGWMAASTANALLVCVALSVLAFALFRLGLGRGRPSSE